MLCQARGGDILSHSSILREHQGVPCTVALLLSLGLRWKMSLYILQAHAWSVSIHKVKKLREQVPSAGQGSRTRLGRVPPCSPEPPGWAGSWAPSCFLAACGLVPAAVPPVSAGRSQSRPTAPDSTPIPELGRFLIVGHSCWAQDLVLLTT